MSEQEIEKEIQDKGLNAPRLTPDHIDSVIQSVHYFTAGDGYAGALASSEEFNSLPEGERFINPPQQLDLLTFCVIVLENGFTVTGESACASPENFNAKIGQKVAYGNAREKIWELEGYLLKEKLYQDSIDKEF
ncbi:Gp49 family protein [Acinetobacter radioresistens]|uniref:Gp49 family protein n=1 Tax=Acinetobacter radioresistens TaxID=40216 RepID=UPI00061954EC|nr:Gp49 family protein [Acinetobacter radioresistens]